MTGHGGLRLRVGTVDGTAMLADVASTAIRDPPYQ